MSLDVIADVVIVAMFYRGDTTGKREGRTTTNSWVQRAQSSKTREGTGCLATELVTQPFT
jgi:hypothetical protein